MENNKLDEAIVQQFLKDMNLWEEFNKFLINKQNLEKSDVTIVTGLWDLGRGNLDGWAKRDFSIYKENFFRLLKSNVNMCIWVPRELEEDIWKIRSKHNTKIYYKELEDFKTWFPFYGQHEKIRTSPNWSNQVGWLTESPQAKLPEYNPMMMSKMFMVNDSAILNPFSTNYFYWMDGGLTSTVSDGYFTGGEIFKNISSVYDKSIVNIVYPYEPVDEIHGFHKNKFYENCELASSTKQVLISRGGFWGGPKELIHKYNELYYSVLSDTILSGYAGADECLFTILAHKHPEIVEQFEIDGNGLVWPFFEAMQNVDTFVKPKKKSTKSTSLYVLGFNSPEQFERLCESFKSADENFLNKPRKILINNSTDISTFDEYDRLCGIYGFEEIHFDNIGICGGRQFIAEHFEESGAEFYMFFEDDMLLNNETVISERCKMGFTKYIPNLYNAITNIMKKEQFDFLKFSFSEFYGDNSVQWAWYNVPQNIRTLNWPEYDKLPEIGLDAKSPKTKFSSIKTIDGVPVITGEIYYSNWPQIVSKTGNEKMFLATKWPHPYEQTWMSHIFQETVAGNINPAILLASTITHDRFAHYPGADRREN
jgi:hypothetical protein